MKAIVVEDSRLAREGLVRMLGAHPEIEVVGQADHPANALPLARAHRPDVIFLDIHMPGANGFELLEALDYMPRVVFTTAFSEYAIRSFDYHTVDYLLKPISPERLALAVRKLGQDGAAEPDAPQPVLDYDSKILVKDGERCHLLSLSEITSIDSCKNYVQIFFDGKRAYLKKSLNSVEERLPRRHFFRANRAQIVNLQAIRSIEESIALGYMVVLSDGRKLEISRRNAATLKSLLTI